MNSPLFNKLLIAVSLVVTSSLTFADDATQIDIFPAEIRLTTNRHPVHIFVTRSVTDAAPQDITRTSELSIQDESIARIIDGRIHAVASGRTTLHVSTGSARRSVAVSVQLDESQSLRLKHDVLPVLSRQGCSSGACHGSPKGKGGFRLSLRAFDPSVDEETLRNEFFSRRTNPLNPETSLLLRKPLMEVPHAGGRRLLSGSAQHRILRDWIAEGARPDASQSVVCTGVEIFPKSGRELTTSQSSQQYAAFARFSDGSVRDVTDLAVFTSSDTSVAEVSQDGVATRTSGGRGQAAISARYLEHMATSFVLSITDVEGFEWPKLSEANYIDKLIHERLRQLQFVPAQRCTDSEFVRRIYLDVTGLLPSVDAATSFLADTEPKKREKLIDELLKSPEHAKFWALKWGDILRIKAANITSPGVFKYHRWLVRAFQNNMPYDEFARQLLTSTGSTFENPAANYYRTAAGTNDCTESTAQIFLGARLECARCHNHPHERWTQDNYYGLGAFFNRIQRDTTERPNEVFVSVTNSGEVTQPRTGQTMQPWLPGSDDLPMESSTDRRIILAEWLAAQNNPYFAHVEVNRLWSQLNGQGIVDPIDDFRASNPPSNTKLLNALAKDFVDQGFDRRHILRTILNSQTYQRSARFDSTNEDDDRYGSRYYRRLLSAEQLMDAISDVTGIPDQFSGLPSGTRATQLPSPDFGKSFLKIFGQPQRKTVCQCERSDDVNLSQALQLANGSFLNDKVMNGNCRFRVMLKEGRSQQDIVTWVYLAAYSRPPTTKELKTFADYAADRKERTRWKPTKTCFGAS